MWSNLEVLVSKRLLANKSASLRLLVSGPALSSGRKEHVSHRSKMRWHAVCQL
jgi:hypothetical protein